MKVVILCGGKGTRAYPFTEYLPKPMLPVDGSPILVQVMRLFMDHGYDQFVLSVGHRRAVISDYFEGKQIGARIEVVDTGEETDTGGRILGCREVLGDRFFATYADGLSDVPIDRLVAFHESHKAPATITSVPLISQYGTLVLSGEGRVERFQEKPVMREHWINAGFFVFDRRVFDHWEGKNLERDVFPHLAKKGLVYAYRHEGFFKSMDSYKDQQEFEQMAAEVELEALVGHGHAAAAEPPAGLDHRDLLALLREQRGGAQPRGPRPDDRNVDLGHQSPPAIATISRSRVSLTRGRPAGLPRHCSCSSIRFQPS